MHWLTDDQRALRDMAANFARKELEPIANQIDLDEHTPDELVAKAAALGFYGLYTSPEYGGSGADLVSVCLVSEEIAQPMNLCAADFPAEEDELVAAGLTAMPSVVVRPPWIKESPVSFECKRMTSMEVGTGNRVVIGEVVYMHIDDRFVDSEKMYVDAPAMKLIGRMHGRGWYVKTGDAFDMPRIAYADWAAERDRKRGT